MKYGSAFKILVICMILGVIGEGCVLLLGLRFHLELRTEQSRVTDALKKWNNYNGRTAQLLFSSRTYPELLSQWISSVNEFDSSLKLLSDAESVRYMEPVVSLSLDNLNSLWNLSYQRTGIIEASIRDLSAALDDVLPPVGGLLFNLGKLSANVTEAEMNRIFILRTNVRELLSMNEEFYLILSGMVERSSSKVEKVTTDSLVFMAILSIGIIFSALWMAIKISHELTRTNTRLINQIRDTNLAQEQLRIARDVAEAADRSKTQFLANVSHELRTPLNSIIGYAELNLIPDEQGGKREFSPLIIKESEKLLHLVNDLLDFSKLEFHKLKLERIQFALPTMISDSTTTLKFRAERKGLDFSIEIDPEIPERIIGDPYRLRQVIVNLLDNAVKFTELGMVSLRVSLVKKTPESCILQFSVEDTGIGIPQELQQQIFEGFTQADGSMSRRYGGTGLGTTIARHLVWLMEGEMKLSSIPGKGSRFQFTGKFGLDPAWNGTDLKVPIDDLEEMLSSERHTESILLVDDYQPNADVAREFLCREGYTVDWAPNGNAAYELARTKRYDLVLMDVQMPGLDGYETTRLLREKIGWAHNVPILALTANAFESDREKAISSGMTGLLSKPVRRETLLSAVSQRLSEHASNGNASVSGTDSSLFPEQAGHALDGPVLLEQFLKEIGDVETAWHLLRGFMEAVESQIPVIRNALAEKDLVTLHREAHSVKGGALNIMAPKLSEAARLLEKAAHENDCESILKLMEPFMTELNAVKSFLSVRSPSPGGRSSRN